MGASFVFGYAVAALSRDSSFALVSAMRSSVALIGSL